MASLVLWIMERVRAHARCLLTNLTYMRGTRPNLEIQCVNAMSALSRQGQHGDPGIVHNTDRARAHSRCMQSHFADMRGTHLNMEIESVIAKGSLLLPGQHGDVRTVENTERARALYAKQLDLHAMNTS